MSLRGIIKDFWREQRLFEQRAIAAVVIIATLSLLIVGRLVWLQVVRYGYYTDLSQGNRVRIEPLPAPRGIIYDRQGLILAENQPAYQLELVPEQVPDLDATLQGLVRSGCSMRMMWTMRNAPCARDGRSTASPSACICRNRTWPPSA